MDGSTQAHARRWPCLEGQISEPATFHIELQCSTHDRRREDHSILIRDWVCDWVRESVRDWRRTKLSRGFRLGLASFAGSVGLASCDPNPRMQGTGRTRPLLLPFVSAGAEARDYFARGTAVGDESPTYQPSPDTKPIRLGSRSPVSKSRPGAPGTRDDKKISPRQGEFSS